jgi:hypothetical protein
VGCDSENFSVSRNTFQSVSFYSNSPSQLLVYAQESTNIKKTNQNINRLLQLVTTACHAPITVRMPQDAAGPARCPCVTRMRMSFQNHYASRNAVLTSSCRTTLTQGVIAWLLKAKAWGLKGVADRADCSTKRRNTESEEEELRKV